MAIRDDTKGGDYSEISEVSKTENLITVVKEKNDKLEKEIIKELDALKKETKEMKEQVDSLKKEIKDDMKEQVDALKKEIKDEMKEQMEALKKKIHELKWQVESQKVAKSEKRDEENELKSQSWKRMKSALHKYDVSMDGIQAFQRFRLYCEARHLLWPLPPEEERNGES